MTNLLLWYYFTSEPHLQYILHWERERRTKSLHFNEMQLNNIYWARLAKSLHFKHNAIGYVDVEVALSCEQVG